MRIVFFILLITSNIILSQNKSEGVLVGPGYKLIFDETVPKTTLAFSRLIKKWKESGVLDNLLRL